MNFKKSAIIAAMLLSANAMAADPTASVVWSGSVPGSVEGTKIKITGLGGGAIASGSLAVARDGTFTSTEVNLESRKAESGELQFANWRLGNSFVNYGSATATGANLVVKANGEDWSRESEIKEKSNISLSVTQDKAIEAAPGEVVQAQVTVVASAAV